MEGLTNFRPVDKVGEWVTEKHDALTYYVKICHGVRRKFSQWNEATYVDLYCGSGKYITKCSSDPRPGSALAAALAARQQGSPFDRIFVADKDPIKAQSCCERLRELEFNARFFVGTSDLTCHEVLAELNPRGFHFVFLDPFSLNMPFEVLRAFQQLKHVDLLVHVSEMDIQRNLEMELDNEGLGRLDAFAPGWRKHIDLLQPKRAMMQQYLDYWAALVESIGWKRPPEVRAVKNSRNRRIYHLALLSQNDDLAARFWRHTAKADPNQSEMF